MPAITNFTLVQLQYALAVARSGQFSRAAEQCSVSQPSLSMQIAKLERLVGGRLFDRDSQEVRVTRFGERFLEQASRVMSELGRLESIAELETQSRGARVRLGLIPTVAPSLASELAHEFVLRFPEARLSVHEQMTAELVAELRSASIDAAIAAIPLHEADLEETALYIEPFVVCMPEAHPLRDRDRIAIADLPEHEIILLREGHCLRNQALELCRIATSQPGVHIDPPRRPPPTMSERVTFETGSFETLLPLVRAEEGITLVPALRALDTVRGDGLPRDAVDGLVYREFESPAPSRLIGLVNLRDERQKLPIAEIVRIVTGRVQTRLSMLRSSAGTNPLEPFPAPR